MTLKIGVLMDAIETIKPYKDSTFAMMLSAQARGHELYYFQQSDVFTHKGEAYARTQGINVIDTSDNYYHLTEPRTDKLSQFDVILMRKDPPFDLEFIYTTYALEIAQQHGTLVVNPPSVLRDVNEKFSITLFPDLTPETLVTRDMQQIREFMHAKGTIVVKPMDGMGGAGIFKVTANDPNANAILEALGSGRQTIMAQTYLENVTAGDKRILLVDGEAPDHALARIPQGTEFRANMAVGGIGEPQPLTQREREICRRIKPWIQEKGLFFVGLDVIDGHLTEINVTSPTGIREIEKATGENIAERLIETIELTLAKSSFFTPNY